MKKEPMLPCAFSYMLMEFNELVSDMPPISKIDEQLFKLREAASINHELNSRQKDAIIDRVDNYLKGDYGKSKQFVDLQTK